MLEGGQEAEAERNKDLQSMRSLLDEMRDLYQKEPTPLRYCIMKAMEETIEEKEKFEC